jgi:kynurenine 3-monooxygenase
MLAFSVVIDSIGIAKHSTTMMCSPLLLLFITATELLSTSTGASFITPLQIQQSYSSASKTHLQTLQTTSADPEKGWDLNVAIVGAGPSGLLLAHRLVRSNLPLANIDVFESRPDPRDTNKQQGSRAYALGLGIRGRTAIRSVDEDLWLSIKERGFECERFRLHFSKQLNVKLRDREEGVEPSVLIYQTDLCAALLDELEKRSQLLDSSKCNVKVHYETIINEVDLVNAILQTNQQKNGPYDLIVGCDGANSIVRDALKTHSPPNTFQFTQRKLLPGCFKVARFEKMPPLLDQNSVALILPESKSLGVTAFVEPTVDGGCCILFAGRLSGASKNDEGEEEVNLNSLLFSDRKGELRKEMIFEQFPLLEGTPGMDSAVLQLLNQRTSTADSVRCNIYNSPPQIAPSALCGDAAHATGGVSGQGCNSALIDAAVLADCLLETYQPAKTDHNNIATIKRALLHHSLMSYSIKQVGEGLALYDLSFGNDGKTLPIFSNIRSLLSNVFDTIFGGRFGIGKKPLQTLLASSLDSFKVIRRDRAKFYVDTFPSDEELKKQLESVYE